MDIEIFPHRVLGSDTTEKLLNDLESIEDVRRILRDSKSNLDENNGLKYVKTKQPEGIILDLELNNSKSGNTDSFEFLANLKKLKLNCLMLKQTQHICFRAR